MHPGSESDILPVQPGVVVYPASPDPPQDDRQRTRVADLPPKVSQWIREELGPICHIAPIAELVNKNHSFKVTTHRGYFFVKVQTGSEAVARTAREAITLRWLAECRAAVPTYVADRVFEDGDTGLILSWVEAVPLRYLDFNARHAHAYLPQLGVLLRGMHEELARLPMPLELGRTDPDLTVDDGRLELAAEYFLGAAEARAFLQERREAISFVNTLPRQWIHGDMQNKNILLGSDGRLIACDFEVVRYASPLFDLSVDRFFLKLHLDESTRSNFQAALLSGYGPGGELLADPCAARMLRIMCQGKVLLWKYGKCEHSVT